MEDTGAKDNTSGSIADGNRSYKDSFFRSLLKSDLPSLRVLFQEITKTDVPADSSIVINTIENVFRRTYKNDLSFTVGNQALMLLEHQSTINSNLPTRIFTYYTLIYMDYFKNINPSDLHHNRLIQFPNPYFVVFYNGTRLYPERKILDLSDAYFSLHGKNNLDVNSNIKCLNARILVFNINPGYNQALKDSCPILAGYCALIDKQREFNKQGYDSITSLQKAIDYCLKNGILVDFIRTHTTEGVIKMLTAEAAYWADMKVEREIGRDERDEEIARNARKKGWDSAAIADITGLDIETINSFPGPGDGDI